MNLYRLTQSHETGYDTYDAAVVAAECAADAQVIHPSGEDGTLAELYRGTWPRTQSHVYVEYLGVAKPGTKRGVILASFNAG